MTRRIRCFGLAVGLIWCFSGCSTHVLTRSKDPGPAKPVPMTPLILIPGTSASKLAREEGPVLWGNRRNLFQVRSRSELALPIHASDLNENLDDVRAVRLFKKISLIPIIFEFDSYKSFLNRLKREGGYQPGDIDDPKPGDNLFVFVYDWRRDNVEHAAELDRKIRRLKAFFGSEDLRFDVMAHCNAGFVARYYALYGGRDVLHDDDPKPTYEGARNIRNLILAGIPYEGTLLAFETIDRGFRPAPFFFIRKLTRYEAFTMPAFFQLLPPPGKSVIVDRDGRDLGMDLYDPSVWIENGWSVFSESEKKKLQKRARKKFPLTWESVMEEKIAKRERYLAAVLARAKRFHRALDEERFPVTAAVDTYAFVLEWGPTLEYAQFDPESKKLRFRTCLHKGPRYSDGDQILTLTSMRGQYDAAHAPHETRIRARHRGVPANRRLQDSLLAILRECSFGK